MTEVKKEKKAKEPFIVLSKRTDIKTSKAILIRIIAIAIAVVVCGFLTILVTDINPIKVFYNFFDGAFGTSQRTWVTLQRTALLLCISLAVTPAFRMRFWNTGAEGQTLAGALACATLMFALGGKIPEWLLIIILIIGSVLAGMIWGLIPAVFKAMWNTNETLFTLMMNYVAMQLISFFLKIADKSGSNTVGPSILSHGWIPDVFGNQYVVIITTAVILTVFMYIYLNYTKHGYEIAVVGESENTARYIGINVKKVIIRTMALSGALCGIVGLLIVAGSSHSIDPNIVDSRGFTAIMVSWLSKFNPATMAVSSLLLVFLDRGAGQVTMVCGLNESFSDILTGIIIFFIIGCEFFINYKIRLGNRKIKSEGVKE